ncbi:MAG: metalloregulator ArsR/SmtB family transcription factor [bacterium]
MTNSLIAIFGSKVRVKLLLCLADKSKNVTELVTTCGLSQSAISQHLARLRQVGLVEARNDGREVWYSLKSKKAAVICRLLLSLESEISS